MIYRNDARNGIHDPCHTSSSLQANCSLVHRHVIHCDPRECKEDPQSSERSNPRVLAWILKMWVRPSKSGRPNSIFRSKPQSHSEVKQHCALFIYVHLCSSMFIYCTSLPVLRISGLILEVYQGSARQRPVHHCTTPGYGDRFGVGSVNVNEHDTMIHHEPFLASSMHHQNPSDQRDCQGTTRSEQCRVQGIRTICGHEHLWSCQKFGAFMCGAIPL